MEALLTVGGIAALFFLSALIANKLSDLFTRNVKPVLNFRPFNCRSCLTFWLTLFLGIIIATLTTSEDYARGTLYVRAFLVGLLNYFYIKSKFKIYE